MTLHIILARICRIFIQLFSQGINYMHAYIYKCIICTVHVHISICTQLYMYGMSCILADVLSRKQCSPDDHANGECQPTVSFVSQGFESWALMWSYSELLQKLRADPGTGVILFWKEQGNE